MQVGRGRGGGLGRVVVVGGGQGAAGGQGGGRCRARRAACRRNGRCRWGRRRGHARLAVVHAAHTSTALLKCVCVWGGVQFTNGSTAHDCRVLWMGTCQPACLHEACDRTRVPCVPCFWLVPPHRRVLNPANPATPCCRSGTLCWQTSCRTRPALCRRHGTARRALRCCMRKRSQHGADGPPGTAPAQVFSNDGAGGGVGGGASWRPCSGVQCMCVCAGQGGRCGRGAVGLHAGEGSRRVGSERPGSCSGGRVLQNPRLAGRRAIALRPDLCAARGGG